MDQADHDARSLALNAVVCARLRGEPRLVARALAVLDGWERRGGGRTDDSTRRWRSLLEGGDVDLIVAAALDPSERGDQLRQSSPLAVLMQPRERWAWRRAWREAHGP